MAEEKLSIELDKAINKILDDEFYKYMHEEFYKLMFEFIPYYTGNLSSLSKEEGLYSPYEESMALQHGLNSGNITADGIFFPASYSEDVYYSNRDFSIRVHPLATSDFGEVALNAKRQELENKLNEYIDRRSEDE